MNLFHLILWTGNAVPIHIVSCELLHAATSYDTPVHIEHGRHITSLSAVQAFDM